MGMGGNNGNNGRNGSAKKSKMGLNVSVGKSVTGRINKISYCAFSIILNNPDGTLSKKVIYVQKFPPAAGTTIPNVDANSTPEELAVDPETKDTLVSFWTSPDSRQVNGMWKGGAWGIGNLLTTDPAWCTGGFIGDTVTITVVANGIIPYKGGNVLSGAIIPGSEGKALSCTIDGLGGKSFGGYVTENIMPQVANDVLFIYKNAAGKKFIKMLKRGVGANVDMPARMMPGAGEHVEPGKDVKVKAGVIRAINEEIGIPPETVADCYLIPLGVFADEGRDPRYWEYAAEQNGTTIEFGMKRGSSSSGYVIYYESPSGAEPKEENPLDTEEVNKKWWHPFDEEILNIDEDDWMIIDHKKIVEKALTEVAAFEGKSAEEKAAMKMAVSGGGRRRNNKKQNKKTQKNQKKNNKRNNKSRKH